MKMANIAAMTAALDVFAAEVKTTDVPLTQLLTFLHVAMRGELPLTDLEKLTGVVQSSVSRNVARMGPGATPAAPGLGLMETYEDPWYRRRKLVRITERGRKLASDIEKALLKFAR